MNNDFYILVAKKRMQRAIITEFYKKNIISFYQYNTISKRIDQDILRLEKKVNINGGAHSIIVKTSI